MENYIETRLSDGMQAFHMGEADTVICAGMGGRLMQKILTEGQQKVEKLQDMILQPQSEISLFRKFLRQQGYTIVQENMIWEEGKFYPMMRVVPYLLKQATDTVPSELADKFGGHLLMQRHPVLAQYLQYKKEEYRQILTGLTAYARNTGRQADRRKEILSELQEIEAAEKYMSERVR